MLIPIINFCKETYSSFVSSSEMVLLILSLPQTKLEVVAPQLTPNHFVQKYYRRLKIKKSSFHNHVGQGHIQLLFMHHRCLDKQNYTFFPFPFLRLIERCIFRSIFSFVSIDFLAMASQQLFPRLDKLQR